MSIIIKNATYVNGQKVSDLIGRDEFPPFASIQNKYLQIGIPGSNTSYYKIPFSNSHQYNLFIDKYCCYYSGNRTFVWNPWQGYEEFRMTSK